MRNTKGTKPLENLLDRFGIPRWPIVHQDFQMNVMNTLADMIRELGLSAIVSVRVGPDHHDTRRHIVYLGQPEFGVEREVLRSPFGSPYFRIRHRYKLFIFRSAQILGSTVAAAESVVNEIVNFEGKLAAISEEPTDLPNPKKSFHLISMESLESTVPNMKWTSFLNSVLRDAQVSLDKYDRIILSNRHYLLRLGGILAMAKTNVVANYLAWRVVELMGPLTVERLRRCRFRFDRYRYSMFDLPELSRECYEHTARYMRFATAKLLYDDLEEKPVERHDKVQHVADEVKDAFAVWLDLTSWMTESNKKLAVFKANNVTELRESMGVNHQPFHCMARNYVQVDTHDLPRLPPELRDVKVNPGAPLWVMSEVEVDEYYARVSIRLM
ncbi:neprilysin-1-like [Amblyomma americanum]